ncbi:UNVERIFIED_CONTAM: hypothetical protein Sradi_4037800 [Sesamum radiatum]|uniref:Uncharacterized protein n=1 Tax=Sesamum radiatum TaxID=300843 RepID=A0AAW2PIC1_SESRA
MCLLWATVSYPCIVIPKLLLELPKTMLTNGNRRHIRIRHGAVKELLKNGIISLDYVRSGRNLTDPLTKGLTRKIIFESSRAIRLKPLD